MKEIIAHLGLEHALRYAKPAGTKQAGGVQLSILSGRYTVDV